MRRTLLVLALLCLVASAAVAVTVTSGTLTVTRSGNREELHRVDLDWATEIHSGKVRASDLGVDGRVVRLVVDSDVGTSVQIPTTGYDVRLKDADGYDILGGAGVGVTTTTLVKQAINVSETSITTGTLIPFLGPLTLEIDDAGTTPTRLGRVRLYLVRDR
jgi:hypothetical protein